MRIRPTALVAALLTLGLATTGCSAPEAAPAPSASGSADLQSEYGLVGLDARAVIEKLDTTPLAERPEGLQASIRPDELILVDPSGDDLRMPMPADEVYIAFAPYVGQTHECTFHAPNSCVGEMRAEPISVTITDRESGRVYYDEQATTYDNGFIGYWLPRDVDATLSVTAGGRTGSVDITTRGADAATCITTLQLA